MEVYIKVGTTVVDNGVSTTNVIINGEERKVVIRPAKYATMRQILVEAVKFLTD